MKLSGRENRAQEESRGSTPSFDVNLPKTCLLAVALGFVTGIVAVAFRLFLAALANFVFTGTLSFELHGALTPADALPSSAVIFIPVLGSLAVTLLVRRFAPEAGGSGVPDLLQAVEYRDGRLRPRLLWMRSLASAISIGTGASLGREGPIIHLGGVIGSLFGPSRRASTGERVVLIAAGAGAGIAASFNTPLAGVLFALELVLSKRRMLALVPVTLAVAVATVIGQAAYGSGPLLESSELPPASFFTGIAALIPLAGTLGAAAGLISAAFIAGFFWAEDRLKRTFPNPYLRHAVGMLLVGFLLYGLQRQTGHPYVDGVGTTVVQMIWAGSLSSMGLLLLLTLAKWSATLLSLGSGGSGGVFGPTLFIGASLGGAFAAALSLFFPELAPYSRQMIACGMGAMMGAVTGANLTAIAGTFELTDDPGILLPTIIATAVAAVVRSRLTPENLFFATARQCGYPVRRT
jgi:CIC family chloride channel protein